MFYQAVPYHILPNLFRALAVDCLLQDFSFCFQIPSPVMNELGRVISDPFVDPYEARSGIAQALGKLSPCLTEDQVIERRSTTLTIL